jgi:hypothetical protein
VRSMSVPSTKSQQIVPSWRQLKYPTVLKVLKPSHRGASPITYHPSPPLPIAQAQFRVQKTGTGKSLPKA